MMKIYNFKFPPKTSSKIEILCNKLINPKCSTNLLIFSFTRTGILFKFAQLAHEELFK